MDNATFSLADALKRGPVVLAFFKITCPVCQFALPYVERLYQAHRAGNVTIVGISQNDKSGTAAFLREYGLTLPVLLDDARRYPVSNAYGLTNVPTFFLVAADGEIEIASVGWSRTEFEQISAKLAQAAGQSASPIFRPGEDVPDWKAG
jgi:peroxiredoxin